jgi:hypothetical protein
MPNYTQRKIVAFAASALLTLECLGTDAEAVEHAVEHMPPLTSPTRHEGAHINTELRAFYLYNKLPKGFMPPAGKGSIHEVVVQGRFAINERWGLMVRKLGFVKTNFEDSLPEDSGLTNLSFGVKYAILAEPTIERYLTVGTSYEAPIGTLDAGNIELQGGGSGMSDTFLSFSTRAGDKTAFQASAGFDMALDSDHDNSFFHYSFHVDHELLPNLFGVFEGNLLTTIREAGRNDASLFGDFNGYDVFNFGSSSGGTVVTLGGGARYRFSDYLLVGAGVEFPVTSDEDIVDFRIIADTTIQF